MKTEDSIKNLNTSIVFQASGGESPFGEPGLLLGAGPEGLGQFIDDPEVQPSSDGPPVFVSMRNQLTLLIAPSILVFRDASGEAPSREDFPGRVARVAEHIANVSRLSYDKIGMRFEIESKPADEELPSQAMLRRLVRREALKGMGYDVIGASARVWYMARGCLHSLHIYPGENEHDSKDYTAHLAVQFELKTASPFAAWLSQALDEEYLDFLKVLGQVLSPMEG